MTVAFEQLGPGQVGRLAYQVIGKDGPIFNPRNIQYLPPSQGSLPQASEAELLTGLAGIGLAVSVGNLALSAATLREVHRLQEQVAAVLFGMERMEGKIDAIAQKVDRIDMRVAENNLREALRHVMGRAIRPEEINLSRISDLRNDFDNLFEAMDAPVYFNFGIRLATDVRDHLTALFAVLHSVRTLVANRHNAALDGESYLSVTVSPLTDYFVQLDIADDINSAIAYSRLIPMFEGVLEAVSESVGSRFSFSDEDDLKHFNALLDSRLADPLEQVFRDHFQGGKVIYGALPNEIFEGTVESVSDHLYDLAQQWLWHSDGGLLIRTKTELDALALGYEKVFWKHLSDEDIHSIGTIQVSVTVPA